MLLTCILFEDTREHIYFCLSHLIPAHHHRHHYDDGDAFLSMCAERHFIKQNSLEKFSALQMCVGATTHIQMEEYLMCLTHHTSIPKKTLFLSSV